MTHTGLGVTKDEGGANDIADRSHTPGGAGQTPGRPAGHGGTLAAIWGLALGLIALLSTWPFEVKWALATPGAWVAFLDSWGWRTSQGNAAGNVLLFAPVGVLVGLTASRTPASARALVACAMTAVSLGLSVGLQIAQIVLPSRHASLVDAVWNSAGFVCGAGAGAVLGTLSLGVGRVAGGVRALPTALVGVWIAYRLAPFVPSLDLQTIKDNLKPLLDPALPIPSVAANGAAWLAAIFLLREATVDRSGARWAPALMLTVLFCEVLIVGRDGVGPASVAGAGAALVVWFGLLGRLRLSALGTWACLAGGIATSGLWPFSLSAEAVQPFYWRPFLSILHGDMWLNTLALTWKAFAYGALVYIGWCAWRSWLGSALAGIAVIFVIEWLQRFQTGHVPEITDPLLVLLAALAGWAVSGMTPSSRRGNPHLTAL